MLKFGCKVTNFYSSVQIFFPKKHSDLHKKVHIVHILVSVLHFERLFTVRMMRLDGAQVEGMPPLQTHGFPGVGVSELECFGMEHQPGS